MEIIRDDDKCINCTLCVQECVAGVWHIVDEKPEPVDISLCNRCSHCVAVCPRDAVIHEGLDTEQIVRVNRKNLLPEVYREIILGRRSVRHYKDTPVPESVIEQIIDIGRYAPTSSNSQNVGYIVITDREIIKKAGGMILTLALKMFSMTKKGAGKMITGITGLSRNRYIRMMDFVETENRKTGRDFILYNAPVLVLLYGPARVRFAGDNCNIAAATIINYAHSLGFGTCYTGLLTMALSYSKKMRKLLGVPDGSKVYASFVMGYPSYLYAKTVSRKKADIKWIT